MKIFINGWVISLLCNPESFAQLNETDTAKFQLRSSVTGNYQQGNVDLLNIKTRVDLLLRSGKNWAFKSQNNHLYQAFYGRKADNDVFSRNWWYYLPQEKCYVFAITYIAANFRRKINLWYFAGAGMTLRSVQNNNNLVKLSVCAVFEQSRFGAVLYNDPHFMMAVTG